MSEIDDVSTAAVESASRVLESCVEDGAFFRPVLEVHGADAQPVALFVFTKGTDERPGDFDEINWREVMAFIAKLSMAGFARAQYITLTSDTHLKTAERKDDMPRLERGDLQRMREAGDDSIRDALMVMTYGRSESRHQLLPYHVEGGSVIWEDEQHFDHIAGYLPDAMQEAISVPGILDMIAGDRGVPVGRVWEHISAAVGLSVSAVRAHQDVAALRVLLDERAIAGYYLVLYRPEDEEAADIFDDARSRLAEWNENLVTAAGLDELIEKMRTL